MNGLFFWMSKSWRGVGVTLQQVDVGKYVLRVGFGFAGISLIFGDAYAARRLAYGAGDTKGECIARSVRDVIENEKRPGGLLS